MLRYGADAIPARRARARSRVCIDGRIRRSSERIRVTIQLLNVRDETTAWAGQFDEQFTDVLNLEDTISSHVAEAIVPHLTVDQRLRLAKRGTDNPQAHEAYLRGRFYWNTFTEDGFARAIVCYQQAIALDPKYAFALAGVASYHNWLGVFSVMPYVECSARLMKLRRPRSSSTRTSRKVTLPWARPYSAATLPGAAPSITSSVELDPNYSPARIWYALQLAMEGRFSESLREAHIGRDLDPLAIISRFSVFGVRITRAALMRRIASPAPPRERATKPDDALRVSFVLSRLSRHDEAVEAAERCVELMGKASIRWTAGCAHAAAGNLDAHRRRSTKCTSGGATLRFSVSSGARKQCSQPARRSTRPARESV